MAIVLGETWQVSVGDEEAGAIDLGPYLDVGELLTAVAVAELDTSDLTIADESVSTIELEILGETVPPGEAIQFTFKGMVVDVLYKLDIQITTGADPPRVKNYCQLIQTAPDC